MPVTPVTVYPYAPRKVDSEQLPAARASTAEPARTMAAKAVTMVRCTTVLLPTVSRLSPDVRGCAR
jgi:hypothetical protein